MGRENGVGHFRDIDPRSLKIAKSKRKSPGTPLGDFVDEVVDVRQMTARALSLELGQRPNFIRNLRAEVRIPMERIATFLSLFDDFDLSEAEKTRLAEATEATITHTLNTYGYLPEIAPVTVKSIQNTHANGCETFTANQAAELMGVSETAVRERREQLNLPYIMTRQMVREVGAKITKAKNKRSIS